MFKFWSELDQKSLEAMVVDDGRDLSHINMPLYDQFVDEFTEVRLVLVRKLELLVDHFLNSK